MRARRGVGFTVAVALGVSVLLPATSNAALTIGSNLGRGAADSIDCSSLTPPGCTFVLAGLKAGSEAPGGLTSPVNGTITAWRIRAIAFSAPTALRVIRPVGVGTFTGAGTSPTVTPATSGVSSFPVQIPIAIGDYIGIDCCGGGPGGYLNVDPEPGVTWRWYQPPLADGSLGRPYDASNSTEELLINADIEPTSSFTLGQVTRNKKRGTATLSVTLPNSGELTGSGKGVKVARAAGAVTSNAVTAPGTMTLTIRAKGKKKRKLNKTGKVRVKPNITFTPTGGNPTTESKKLKLKKR